jgi:hypothetical protein
MLQMHQPMEIKSGHVVKGRLTRCKQSGKNGKSPLLGRVCLLTTRDLISVRPGPALWNSEEYFEPNPDLHIPLNFSWHVQASGHRDRLIDPYKESQSL